MTAVLAPPPEAPRPGRWRRVLPYLLAWTAFALLSAGQHYAAMVWKDPQVRFVTPLRAALTDWGAWAAITPLLFLAVRRFSFLLPGARVQAALAHLLLAPLFGALQLALHVLIDVPVEWALGAEFSAWGHARQLAPRIVFTSVFTYAALVAVAHVIVYVREARERRQREMELERHLSDARLQVLQMQLQPHFLFNALNSIAALMHSDVAAADRMLARLSELLRISLDTAGVQEVTLRDELRHLQPYLDIEARRFGDRLSVEVVAPDALLDAKVPSLLLQPLVENAIRHGIARRAGPGHIRVEAAQGGAQVLRLTVTDDGPGTASGAPRSLGVGLSNTRARLEQLYGAQGQLGFGNAPRGGFEVQVTVPLRTGGDDGRPDASPDRR